MGCHSVGRKMGKYIRGRLVDRVCSMVRVDKHIGVAVLPIGLATHCCIRCMEGWVSPQ